MLILFSSKIKGKYSCFSNYYRSEFTLGGITYNSIEQFYNLHKAITFYDGEVIMKILMEKNIFAYAKLTKNIKYFSFDKWIRKSNNVIKRGLLLKFTQNKKLKKILLETNENQLINANKNDKYWGIGFDLDNAVKNKDKWGENKFGILLMEVRSILQNNTDDQIDKIIEYLQ